MERVEAKRTLEEVDRVRLGTRQVLNSIWFSNIVVGAFFAGTVVVAVADSPEWVAAAYWIGGALLALGLIFRRSLRIQRELGVDGRPWDAVATITCALIAAIVLTSLLVDFELAPLVAGVLALLAYGYVLRDPFELAACAGLAILIATIALAEPDSPGLWGVGALAVVLIAAGTAGRLWGAARGDAIARA